MQSHPQQFGSQRLLGQSSWVFGRTICAFSCVFCVMDNSVIVIFYVFFIVFGTIGAITKTFTQRRRLKHSYHGKSGRLIERLYFIKI